MNLKPIEALDQAINYAIVCETQHERPNPGKIIQGMGKEAREALSKLTSCEAKKMLFYDCTGLTRGSRYAYHDQKLKEEFNGLIRKGGK